MKTLKFFYISLILLLLAGKAYSQPEIFVNTYYLTFGEVPLGTTVNTYFTINNLGNDTLEVSNIAISNEDFSLATTSLIVLPNTWVNVDIVFTPSALGVYDETLSVESNDPNNPVFDSPATANVILPAPAYLFAQVSDNDVELSWGANGPEGDWLHYDNGTYIGSYGINQTGTWRIAARWPADALSSTAGNAFTRVAFFPTGEATAYTLKIWKGNDAETLLYSNPLTNLDYGVWNEALISEPVVIEEGEMYWVGLELAQLDNWDGSAAIDLGPAVAGYGDMVNLGGDWFSATGAGFDYNWLIRAFVGENNAALAGAGKPEVPLPSAGLSLTGDDNRVAVQAVPKTGARNIEILGYNIYRDGEQLNAEPVNNAIYPDNDLEAGIYLYGVTALYAEGESLPVERSVQVGGPLLSVQPGTINETLQGGDTVAIELTLANQGSATLDWEVDNLPVWITLSHANGSIIAGETATLILTINTIGVSGGTNTAFVKFTYNNINNPQFILPVVLTVEDYLPAVFDESILDFGTVPVLESKLMSVNMTNMTDALLMFQSFTTVTDHYTAYPPTWALQPGESMEIIMTFSPPAVGAFIDTLFVEHFGYLGSGVVKLPLTGQGILLPPAHLTAMLDENTVSLDWLPPGASSDQLRFGSGQAFSSIGTSAGTYEVAARFAPSDLMPYSGKQLDKVGFYVHSTNAGFRLKVYTGADANISLIDFPVNNLDANAWNDISLPFPIQLDDVDYLWIGYEMEQTQTAFIAGVDGGPGVTGSGDLIRVDGNMWMTLADYGWSYNWNIRGLLSLSQGTNGSGGITELRSSPELLGYNVYRDSLQLNDEPISELTYTDQIESGEMYVYGVTALYDIGESNPTTVTVTAPTTLSMPDGWEFDPTPMAHNIHIPVDVLQIGMDLQTGDMLGVYYMDNGVEKFAGAGLWTGEHLVITAYGNDPSTPIKDGFDEHEPLRWKIYLHQSGESYDLNATYSSAMPHHNGTFNMLGLSMLETLEMDIVGLREKHQPSVNIYPNPSTGRFSIDGLTAGDSISILDASGKRLIGQRVSRSTVDVQLNAKGIYMLEIHSENGISHQKVIIY